MDNLKSIRILHLFHARTFSHRKIAAGMKSTLLDVGKKAPVPVPPTEAERAPAFFLFNLSQIIIFDVLICPTDISTAI